MATERGPKRFTTVLVCFVLISVAAWSVGVALVSLADMVGHGATANAEGETDGN